MGETVAIHICNSNVEWLVPFSLVPDDLTDFMYRAIDHDKKPLDLEQVTEGTTIAIPTLWRPPFGLEIVNLYRCTEIPDGSSIEYDGLGELTFWYADKHGQDAPDYFGWGNCDHKGVTRAAAKNRHYRRNRTG